MAQLDQKKSPQEKKPQASLPTVQEMGGPPDSNTVVDKIDEALGGRVRVTHGANDCEFENLAGKSVASVRKALSSVFSIPKDAQPYIKGEVVQEDYKLKQGEQLEFLKQSGTKG